jgi:A/G-specific adenine glycosylase
VDSSGTYLAIANAVASWEREHGRRYPWRHTTDRYTLAVAELLLQKTRGGAAELTWVAMMTRYPDAKDLAAADPEAVRVIVAPLGLGAQRSHRLVAMARALATGSDPVPGLGSYGAGVLSLAAATKPDPAPVDGNVARVVSRLLGLAWARGEPRKKAETRAAAAAILDAAELPLDALYGLVDVGATVCRPRKPHCVECPLAALCAFATGAGGSGEHSIDCADGI